MKNLTYTIQNNKVVFKFVLNTISHYSVSELVSQKLIDYVMESASSFERVVSEINEGNESFYLEQLFIYNDEKHLLLAFDLNKGKRLSESEKATTLETIKNSIIEQKEFTELSLFELRVNDLQYVALEINENKRVYVYQVYQNLYTRL